MEVTVSIVKIHNLLLNGSLVIGLILEESKGKNIKNRLKSKDQNPKNNNNDKK